MTEKFKCKKCGSSYVYTTQEFRVCRKCGHKELLKEVEEDGSKR